MGDCTFAAKQLDLFVVLMSIFVVGEKSSMVGAERCSEDFVMQLAGNRKNTLDSGFQGSLFVLASESEKIP
jgi:hypothetical protein